MARDIAAGEINQGLNLGTRMPPLYIFAMSAGAYIGLGAELTGIMISVVTGTLLVIPVFLIARRFAGGYAGLIAAFLVATHPYLVRLSADVMRDNLFLCLFFFSIYFAVEAVYKLRNRYWYLAGILAGFATLTRSEGVEVILGILLWIGLELLLSLKRSSVFSFTDILKKYGLAVIYVVVAFLAVTVPVQILLAETTSTWTFIDPRIINFIRSFLVLSSEEVLELESQ